jgi:hypothetical protein
MIAAKAFWYHVGIMALLNCGQGSSRAGTAAKTHAE